MAKYRKELVDDMVEWVRENGLIDYGGAKLGDFCSHFGIDNVTYYNWMKKSEFSEAIKKAKEDFKKSLETDIVKSMANAAKGYEYIQTITEFKDVGARRVPVKQTQKNIRVEPNIGAGIFLLTNIAPERWKNRQKNEVDVYNQPPKEESSSGINYDISAVPKDELIRIAGMIQEDEFNKRMEQENGSKKEEN